ncbi:sulfatase-like hydrolase/transferase [Maribellus comscasis]|uniref:Sulfatase-like hydrolase/transferase n=1 Tax=Maribellus comscasis TaxID=2681766 RepID=A0A6I6KBB9_9BACT|nr:arylsulfatase [Maribellus comscasis]QGY47514.1 sulfatase-like hydrolase/transferase [Maribellus comscasis]
MKKILTLLFFVFSITCISQVTKQPNIIIILADDMGYSDLGCTGSEIETPNLDKMASEGVLFTHFYNASVCCPTRASLLTGQYQWDAGMGSMSPSRSKYSEYQGFINERSVTMGEVLKQSGYQTYMGGKWHVGNERDMWPDKRGFDKFYGTPAGGGIYFYPSKFYDRPIFWNGELVKPDTTWYSTDGFTDYAINFIENERIDKKPFFMYLAYIAPHYPLQAKQQDIEKYKNKYSVGYEAVRNARFKKQQKLGIVSNELELSPAVYPDWESVENKEQEAREMAVYAAMVDCMDQNIGRLLKTLKEQGIEENTIVFFLSDNGAGLTDFNKTPEVKIGSRNSNATYGIWHNVSNTPYRKGKQMEHEGGIITPMIARWPAGIKNKGEIIHEPAHINDFMPTCIELAGAKYPKIFNGNEIGEYDGQSFLPLIYGKEQDKERIYFWSFIGNKAIRQGDWKLVQLHEKDWELYNIKNDPTEINDLSKKEQAKFDELHAMYNDFAKEHGVRPWPLDK